MDSLWSLMLALTACWAIDDPIQPWPDTDPAGKQGPVSAQIAAAGFELPEGFQVQVVASEPMIRNPIALAWDDFGRLWIAENGTYSERTIQFDPTLSDRIRILHDDNRDGIADRTSTFAQGLQRLTSIEVGLGGVWAMCPPVLLFLPDHNRDGVADGPGQVVLDGFHVSPDSYHTLANGLRFGPDGWLYGRCGASSIGAVRTPETPVEQAVPIHGGIWRYHPELRTFEVLSHGTTNPWGLDWNSDSTGFFINTVNGHLWQLIPGAHYRRPHSISPNRLVYEPMEMHADHFHWDTSEDWTASRGGQGIHDVTGGGHAHCGVSIYQGGKWPEPFVGKLMTLNLHGRRVNVERLERQGSGYVGRHEPDRFRASDPWFRGLDLAYGPDGDLIVLDWSDTGECHEHDGVHRNSGRVYRFMGGDTPAWWSASQELLAAGLHTLSDAELLELHRHPNQWWVRQARLMLIERAHDGNLSTTFAATWSDACSQSLDSRERLAYFETLQAIADYLSSESSAFQQDIPALARTELLAAWQHSDEILRAAAIRAAFRTSSLDTITSTVRAIDSVDPEFLQQLKHTAPADPSLFVLAAATSALQRLPIQDRQPLLETLARRSDVSHDRDLPSLLWYAAIPLARENPHTLVGLVDSSSSQLRRWLARRCGERLEAPAAPVDQLLARTLQLDPQRFDAAAADISEGLLAGLVGRRQEPAPKNWIAFRDRFLDTAGTPAERTARREKLAPIAALFGEGRSLDELRAIVRDRSADLNQRETALRTLISLAPDDLAAICRGALRERDLARAALVGLSQFNDTETADAIASAYRTLRPHDRPALIETLVSREIFAIALVTAMERGVIPPEEVTTEAMRRLLEQVDASTGERAQQVWGIWTEGEQVREAQIAEVRQLIREASAAANLSRGREIFEQRCANCHRMFGSGGDLGPDLTGSDRRNLEYLLRNVIDPSAVVPREALATLVETTDGRTISGLIVSESEISVSLRSADNLITVPLSEISTRELSRRSIMPDGLLDGLTDDQIVDLFAYLRSETQVSLPPAP